MNSIEMIKCFLSNEPDNTGDVRYIPADIFDMWRFLMERVHTMAVSDPAISLWVSEDVYDKDHDSQPADAVIEIRFRYMDMGEMGRVVTRYFPETQFESIYSMFRNHFPDEQRMEETTRRRGFFLGGASARPVTKK